MSVSPHDKVRHLYDSTADSYEAMMDVEIELPVYDRVLSELAQAIVNVPGAVLDSSCGSGHMLERIATRYCPGRELIGVDLSAEMVRISAKRLGNSSKVSEGDMASLPQVADASCAAIISFFAVHHVDQRNLGQCFQEWCRTLVAGGHLFLAAWEGSGPVDYGGVSDAVARRYTAQELTDTLTRSNMQMISQTIETVEGFEMNAVHIVAMKPTI